MLEILKELCYALGELTASHFVVLLLDTAGCHICPVFMRTASRRGLAVQFVPAKLTWLLQPLDTHVFAMLKRYLVQLYRQDLLQSGSRATELTARLEAVIKACRKVLQAHAWASAFEANGFSVHAQREVRQTILEELQWERVPELPAALPTFPEFVAIFPARMDIPLAALLHVYRHRSAEPPALPLPEDPALHAPEAQPRPWFGRLRSSSSLALALAGPAAPPPLPPPPELPAAPMPLPPPPTSARRPPVARRVFPVGRPFLRPRPPT